MTSLAYYLLGRAKFIQSFYAEGSSTANVLNSLRVEALNELGLVHLSVPRHCLTHGLRLLLERLEIEDRNRAVVPHAVLLLLGCHRLAVDLGRDLLGFAHNLHHSILQQRPVTKLNVAEVSDHSFGDLDEVRRLDHRLGLLVLIVRPEENRLDRREGLRQQLDALDTFALADELRDEGLARRLGALDLDLGLLEETIHQLSRARGARGRCLVTVGLQEELESLIGFPLGHELRNR
mmetsp:Transcript_94995/g.271624  ORF Transcript_94995/g.271624 Transcript_94995/m.271624 type:complete len:235 (+) Transcript_94995:440-1144(+)